MQHPLHFPTRRFASVLATSIPKTPVCARLFATSPISPREHPKKPFATQPSHRLFTSTTTTEMSPAPSATIHFYTGGSLDASSPSDTLEKILTTWSDRTLEARHDYIQHLFPLPERSPVNPDAPVLTKEVRDAFLDPGSQGAALRGGLQKAFGRMCRFYGFVLHEGQGTIAKASNFDERAPDSWLTTVDHNHLRITRIIRCMRILGLQTPARRFLIALLKSDTHQTCSQNSATFWCRAALWDLSKPPSYPRENVVKWLEREEDQGESGGLDGEEEIGEIRQLAEKRGVKV